MALHASTPMERKAASPASGFEGAAIGCFVIGPGSVKSPGSEWDSNSDSASSPLRATSGRVILMGTLTGTQGEQASPWVDIGLIQNRKMARLFGFVLLF